MKLSDIETSLPTDELREIIIASKAVTVTLEDLSWKELINEHNKKK